MTRGGVVVGVGAGTVLEVAVVLEAVVWADLQTAQTGEEGERGDVVLLGDELSAALDAPRSNTPHLHCPPPSISPPPNQSITHSIHEKLAMEPLIIGSSYSLALELQHNRKRWVPQFVPQW
jgi:hypothetical protein